ncbi:MAG TPA: hypothetical protein VGE01_09435 [Fimbriimonas sp.]
MVYLLQSAGLFRRHPRLWRYCTRPLVFAAVAFLGIVLAGYALIVPAITRFLQRGDYLPDALAAVLGAVAYLVAWVFLAGVAFLAIASFLSSFAWDRLSAEIEELVAGVAAPSKLPMGVMLADSAGRTVFSISTGAAALCCGLWLGGVPGIVAAGLIALFDFTASAYVRRGVLFGGQWGRVFRLKGAVSFIFTAGLLSLLPFINVALLPILVGAGTLMVVDSERRSGILT